MNDKELVAHAALDYVEDNMIIGLGTGSTANYFIDGLANKIKSEGLSINVVASSTVSQERANQAGIKYISIDQIEKHYGHIDSSMRDRAILKDPIYMPIGTEESTWE